MCAQRAHTKSPETSQLSDSDLLNVILTSNLNSTTVPMASSFDAVFDVGKHISLVPIFREAEVESYFSVADGLGYEEVTNTILEVYELFPDCHSGR